MATKHNERTELARVHRARRLHHRGMRADSIATPDLIERDDYAADHEDDVGALLDEGLFIPNESDE